MIAMQELDCSKLCERVSVHISVTQLPCTYMIAAELLARMGSAAAAGM